MLKSRIYRTSEKFKKSLQIQAEVNRLFTLDDKENGGEKGKYLSYS